MAIDPDVQVKLDELQTMLNFSNLHFNTKIGELETELASAKERLAALEGGGPVDPPPVGWVPRFAGDTEPGHVRWGAAVGGNSDPARHEDPTGEVLALRRTFFAWRHIDSGYLVNTVRDDHEAGRLPWVSIKPPSAAAGSANGWDSIAKGNHDTEIDNLLQTLDLQNKPIWLTFHHEPENDGLPAAHWRAMQLKVRERIEATGVTNIAFAGILMSWTYFPASGRNPEDWWVDDAWDFVGIDHYIEKENVRFMDVTSDEMWKLTHDFLESKGLPFALGEWGNRGTDADGVADIQRLYDMVVADDDFLGAAAFDSELNAPTGSWELRGGVLTRFHELMGDQRSIGV